MVKVLVICTGGLKYDGITNVILSYLENMSKKKIKIFVVRMGNVDSKIEERIKKANCQMVDLPDRRTHTIRYFLSLIKELRKNHIDVMHVHGNSATLTIEMLAGKLAGIKKRIAHSHNTKCDQVKADKIMRPLFYRLYTEAAACGEAAGRWLFPNRQFVLLKNGRDVTRYDYNLKKRTDIRSEMGWDSKVVLGHVGAFVEQKNHVFLIQVMEKLVQNNPNVRLQLIGDGPLKGDIEQLVSKKKLDKYIYFHGNVDNVQDLIQGMDMMILPSLFEGVPLVMIEWQIAGLPILAADTVSKEAAVTELVTFYPLEKGSQAWADKIEEIISVRTPRKSYAEQVCLAGFDICQNVKRLEEMYIGEQNEHFNG